MGVESGKRARPVDRVEGLRYVVVRVATRRSNRRSIAAKSGRHLQRHRGAGGLQDRLGRGVVEVHCTGRVNPRLDPVAYALRLDDERLA
jgi:hypothetical protein